jgi:radical SAM protein with 4Fe4S-binding SPASM domain
MEMDAIVFLEKFAKKYPELKGKMETRLKKWGGNSAGRKLLNINSEGDVRPDPFFPQTIGNILKEDFGDIWTKNPSELLIDLRKHPRKISGKCNDCKYLDICNGGSRSRAWAIHDDLWAEDPSCYI